VLTALLAAAWLLWHRPGAAASAGGTDAPATSPQPSSSLALADLRDGDLAMIASDTFIAGVVLSVSGPDARYSHCGMIVAAPQGRWALVHAAPANSQTGDRGVTESVDLAAFLRRKSVRLLDVYRHEDAAVAARAADAARTYAAKATPFDAAFNLDDDGQLYCSELVWRAYLRGGAADPMAGRLDRVRSAFLPELVILPNSLATSGQFRRVGVLATDP
jgi:hypothetical protein